MVSKMVNGHTLFLFALMLNFHLQLVNSCENDTCSNAIDVPLISKLNAPLKAELDISILTAQLKELIGHKVEASVSKAVKDLIRQEVKLATTNIAKRVNNAVDYLHTSNNITMSTYMQELKETMMKPAFSAFLTKTINLFSRSDILKFDDVRINLGSHYNPKTGKFTAPKSGLYHISYNLMGYEKSTVTFQINKNNEAFVFGYADGSGYATSPSSVLMKLKKEIKYILCIDQKELRKLLGNLSHHSSLDIYCNQYELP